MTSKHPFHDSMQPICCKEPECVFSCRRINALHDHLKHHGIETKMETMTFASMEGKFQRTLCTSQQNLE